VRPDARGPGLGPIWRRGRSGKRGVFVLVLVGALAWSATALAEPSGGPSYRAARVKAAGISLRHPSPWTAASFTERDFAATLKRLEKQNPKLVGALQSFQGVVSKGLKFFASDFAATAAGRFGDNVLVLVNSGGGFPSTLDEFQAAYSGPARSAGLTVLSTAAVKAGGTPAFRGDARGQVTTPDGRSFVLHEGDLFLPHGDGSVQVQVTTVDTPAETAIVDAVLGSVRRS
jgi:hypothetical protein